MIFIDDVIINLFDYNCTILFCAYTRTYGHILHILKLLQYYNNHIQSNMYNKCVYSVFITTRIEFIIIDFP